jgi:hypothetical protein
LFLGFPVSRFCCLLLLLLSQIAALLGFCNQKWANRKQSL